MAAAQEDLTLPKATVAKLIKEMLPDDIKCANDSRDLIVECCVEFIHLLSSESNDQCTRDKKKTISPEHIIKSLQTLGYHSYVDQVQEVYDHFKEQSQVKTRGIKKLENQDIPEEELELEQQELFAKARSVLRTSQASLETDETLQSSDQME